MAEEKWYTAEVTKVLDESPSTRRFWFKVNDVEKFDFKAGQFVTFDLPIHEVKKKRERSYSIASPPDGSNVFELVIVLVEDGSGTPYMWQHFKPGQTVPIKGPLGKFVLPENIAEEEICFICTGTGIAPFRSMLHDVKQKGTPHNGIHLIFGCRKTGDILYKDELIALQKELSGFNYIYACSRESADNGFEGKVGYVHSIYEEIFADRRKAKFYLCGWRNMLDEARKRLADMGYDRKDIHFEIYG